MGAAFGAIFLYCLAVEYFVADKMFALAMPAYIFAPRVSCLSYGS
jgi:hypothetical protein